MTMFLGLEEKYLKMKNFPRYVDKAFRIILSVVLIWPQMVGAMQNPDGGDPASSRRMLIAASVTAPPPSLHEDDHSQRHIENVSSNPGQEEEKGNAERPVVEKEAGSTAAKHTEKSALLAHSAEAFPSQQNALHPLTKIETLPLRNMLRWANFDSLLQRMGYALVLQTKHIQPNLAHPCCTKPVWLSGGSFPLENHGARQRVLFVDGFRQGAEFIIFRSLHLGITGLALYQLYNYIHQPEPLVCQGTPQSKSVLGLIKFWEASDESALLGFFHDVLGKQNTFLSYLKYSLVAPFVYGLVKGGLNAQDSQWSHEQIQESLGKLAQQTPSMKTDLWRWLLPFDPIDKELGNLMKNVLWNDKVSDEDLEAIWQRLEILATQHAWYTPINALGYAMQWAYGLNDRDLRQSQTRSTGHVQEDDLLEEMIPDDAERRWQTRLALKQKAFELIQKCTTWRPDSLDDKKEVTRHGLRTLYAQYLLWSLGAPRSVVEGVWPTLFKFGKLYAQASIIQKIVDAFLKAETCPQQPGVSMAGVAPWAEDLTQACFEANVRAFNIIPGQPIDTLVGDFDKYYFSDCAIDLDLSGKGLDGETAANIIRSLLDRNITMRLLNLSGNIINTPQDFEVLFPMLEGITDLDLSGNLIGGAFGNNGTSILGAFLGNLTNLTSLKLSSNNIGNMGDSEIREFGKALKKLTLLTSLDLSDNIIGKWGDSVPVALGESLGNLPQLTSLNLFGNLIGYTAGHGTLTLGKALGNLTDLTSLDLSGNCIGCLDSGSLVLCQSLGKLTHLTNLAISDNEVFLESDSECVALGKSLVNLPHLTNLDLSGTAVGQAGNNGTVALCLSFGNLTQLTSLDLSYSWIGGHNESVVLGQSLINLTHLKKLDCSGNNIGRTGSASIIVFAKALSALHQLEFFTFLPVGYDIPSAYIMMLNEGLNHTLAGQLPLILSSPEDVKVYCRGISPAVENINLAGLLLNPDADTMAVLMGCLSNFMHLTGLDLSNNYLGSTAGGGTVTLGESLGNLTHLMILNLSQNEFCFTEGDGTVELAQALGTLHHLTNLDLSGNAIGGGGYHGTIALLKSLGNIPQLISLDLSVNGIGMFDDYETVVLGQSLGKLHYLTSLDLSGNTIGYIADDGTVELGQSLGNLTQLTNLDLSSNYIGWMGDGGTVALGESLGNLTNLTNLDLSDNKIGYHGDDGTVAFGKSLENLISLTKLDLSGNNIGGFTSDSGTVAFGKSLGNLTHLISLDLSGNSIGQWGDDGVIAIAHGLNGIKNLVTLNFGCVVRLYYNDYVCNLIGSTGQAGPQFLIASLVQLPHLDFDALNLRGTTNISWTKSANTLQKLRTQAMAESCQSSKCFGGDVQTSAGGGVQNAEVSVPSTGRRLMSLEEPSSSPHVVSSEGCICTTDTSGWETCVCPSRTPDTLTTLSTSAVTGVVFAALPEALGDILYYSGQVSAPNAYRIKWASNAAFVLASGSWVSAGASWLTSSGLQYAGVSESKARVSGNAAAFLVNVGRNLSPTTVAATAANFAAGHFGLWAEKKMMKKMYGHQHQDVHFAGKATS